MTTGIQILTRAMRGLGCLGRTEVPTSAEATDGLNAFNALLDSMSNEKLMSFVTLEQTFNFTINQQSYSIGDTGADITATRPLRIDQAFVRDTSNLDYPMRVIPQDIWNNIGAKTITSQIPDTLFYDTTYPNGTIKIFPKPLLGYSCHIFYSTNQVTFSTLTQALSMPIGYERMFVLNLSLEMMAYGFPCLLKPESLAALVKAATDAKANIKSNNIEDVIAGYDDAIVSRSYASYNIYSDGRTQ